MNECPCKNCKKRTATCHGECELYKQWSLAKTRERNRNHILKRSGYLDK